MAVLKELRVRKEKGDGVRINSRYYDSKISLDNLIEADALVWGNVKTPIYESIFLDILQSIGNGYYRQAI